MSAEHLAPFSWRRETNYYLSRRFVHSFLELVRPIYVQFRGFSLFKILVERSPQLETQKSISGELCGVGKPSLAAFQPCQDRRERRSGARLGVPFQSNRHGSADTDSSSRWSFRKVTLCSTCVSPLFRLLGVVRTPSLRCQHGNSVLTS